MVEFEARADACYLCIYTFPSLLHIKHLSRVERDVSRLGSTCDEYYNVYEYLWIIFVGTEKSISALRRRNRRVEPENHRYWRV